MMKIRVKPLRPSHKAMSDSIEDLQDGDLPGSPIFEKSTSATQLTRLQNQISHKDAVSSCMDQRNRSAAPISVLRSGPKGGLFTRHDSWMHIQSPSTSEKESITPILVRSASMISLSKETTATSNAPSSSDTKVCWYQQQQQKQLKREQHQTQREALVKQQNKDLKIYRITREENDCDSADPDESKTTITRGLLATSGLVWVPCKAGYIGRSSIDEDDFKMIDATKCVRFGKRRNALADPMKMTMPQSTRERIQKEVATRKNSFTRKFSQYFKAIYSDDYEVDLV